MTLPLSLRFALRELRGGLAGFRIFLACLALGVGSIAAVGSVASAVVAGLKADARILLGGDVELRLIHRTANSEQRAHLNDSGETSEVATMRAMARRPDGERRSLIEMKAVDAAYPLYGALRLAPEQGVADALGSRNGIRGAVVDPLLLERLNAKLGDEVVIGDARFELRATIAREPDVGGGFIFGPRVIISLDALQSTGLVQPASIIAYQYRVRFAPGIDAKAWVADVKQRWPDAGWRIREFGEAAPNVQQFINRLTLFLTLVGLTALLVGGVGIGNAVNGYLQSRTATIATLKCLGAPAGLVFQTYLTQILLIAAVGIAIGLSIGVLAPYVVAHFLAEKLPIEARIGLYPAPLLLSTAFGLLTTLAFSLWPLGRARDVPAASLFRDLVAPVLGRPRWTVILAVALVVVALAGLSIWSAADRRIASWFVVGAVSALVTFRLAAEGVMLLARRAGRPRRPGLRLALANLYRPGAPTPSVVLSLGLGLTVLVCVALIERNMLFQVEERLPEQAPSYFFVDIQPDQIAGFDEIMKTPGVVETEHVPSLRGRITRLNGIAVERAQVASEAMWAIRSERGLTYAKTPPKGTRIVEGEWWPADYKGPPLVSFDAELAKGMGLKIGDTMTINVLGREVTARIANLRQIDWASLGINFALVFAPGTLEAAPQTFIAVARAEPQVEEQVYRAVTDRFPNITAIRVRDALAQVARIFESIAEAVRLTAAITLLAGTLVLAGAIAAGHRRRVYDSVVLKVLGATRPQVARAFLLEYGLLGAVTAVIAGAFGSLAAWLVLTKVMRAEWVFLPWVTAGTAALSLVLTLVLGYAGTWKALGARSAPLLRNE